MNQYIFLESKHFINYVMNWLFKKVFLLLNKFLTITVKKKTKKEYLQEENFNNNKKDEKSIINTSIWTIQDNFNNVYYFNLQ